KEDFEDVLAIADPRGIRPRLILRDAPPTMVQPGTGSRWVFSTQVAQKILALSAAIDAVQNSKNRRLLRVVLGSILIGASNIIVNGKGRRYRRNWQDRKRTADMVERAFRQNFDDVVV